MEPERCAECGFDGARLGTGDAVAALRSLERRFRERFADVPDEILRRRPDPGTWSALEYAAHTRDVLALNGWAMNEILKGEHPSFPAVEPDPEATDHGYNALDPERVLAELGANANRIADRAERELPQHWSRTASVGGDEVEAAYVLRHAVHDATHHLRDVELGLRRFEA